MARKRLIIFLTAAVSITGAVLILGKNDLPKPFKEITDEANMNPEDDGGISDDTNNLSIESLRKAEYPGSDIVIEQTLNAGTNYKRYIASYKSEGLKIYALLTVPDGAPPGGLASPEQSQSGLASPEQGEGGWPVIVFNHGYIPPAQYSTTERYVSYVDGFAGNGFIVFKPDFRGHGNSEGEPSGAYGSNSYTIDVLNAVSSIKKLKDPSNSNNKIIANPERIGMWGHSMGGFLTLRSMVITKDIKAGVIWAGVVGSYPDMLNNWRRRNATTPPGIPSNRRRWREELTQKYGDPAQNPEFWNSISSNSYLADISGPIALHHGTSDSSVPLEFSQKLASQLTDQAKEVELYIYEGDNHNLSDNFSQAMQRSIEFFNKYLKI